MVRKQERTPRKSSRKPASDRAATPVVEREEARAALAARIQRIAEREMDAVERVLDALGPSGQAEADRCARALAGIARTLREITALNQPESAMAAHEADDDTIPVDLDELRCALARELDALIEARVGTENSGSVGPDTQQEPRNA
jgi:hypothetical protein